MLQLHNHLYNLAVEYYFHHFFLGTLSIHFHLLYGILVVYTLMKMKELLQDIFYYELILMGLIGVELFVNLDKSPPLR